MAEFRIEYQDKIKKFIKENKNKNTILVLDHCDYLILLQEKQFYDEVFNFIKDLTGKIILVFEKSTKF